VVGVLGEVVADERVEQVEVLVQLGSRKDDELAVADRQGEHAGALQVGRIVRQQAGAAPSVDGSVEVAADPSTSPGAVGSPPIRRSRRTSGSALVVDMS
jgi:hypothetical protein